MFRGRPGRPSALWREVSGREARGAHRPEVFIARSEFHTSSWPRTSPRCQQLLRAAHILSLLVRGQGLTRTLAPVLLTQSWRGHQGSRDAWRQVGREDFDLLLCV